MWWLISILLSQPFEILDKQLGIGFNGQFCNVASAFLNEKRVLGMIFYLKERLAGALIYDMILEHIVQILYGIKLLGVKLIRYSEFRKYLNGKFKAGIRILDDDLLMEWVTRRGEHIIQIFPRRCIKSIKISLDRRVLFIAYGQGEYDEI